MLCLNNLVKNYHSIEWQYSRQKKLLFLFPENFVAGWIAGRMDVKNMLICQHDDKHGKYISKIIACHTQSPSQKHKTISEKTA